jgi:hypothetical protein
MKKILLTLIFFLICTPAHAVVTYYLCGNSAGGNWNNIGIWTTIPGDESTCSGGTGNYPGSLSTDVAIMNSGSGSVTLNGNYTIATLNMSGYASGSGTFDFGTSHTLTVSGGSTIEGPFTGTTSTLLSKGTGVTLSNNVTGTNPTISLTTAAQAIDSSASLYTNSLPMSLGYDGTITIASGHAWTNGGLLTFNASANLNYGGTSADTFTANGGLTMSVISGSSPTATIILGGGTWSGTSSLYNNLTLARDVTISGGVQYRKNTLTYSSGTITTTGSTLTIGTSCTLNTNGMTWNIITLNGTTVTLTSNLQMNKYLQLAGSINIFSGAYSITTNILDIQPSAAIITALTLPAGQTLNIKQSIFIGGQLDYTSTIKSSTPSSPAYINYTGSLANEAIFFQTFTDVYATGPTVPFYGPNLLNYNGGTLTRTQGIVNVNASQINKKSVNYYTGV